jgi:uncharacterized protein YggT (Ycf19 family)
MAKHKFVTRSGRVVERDDDFRETLAPAAPAYREVIRDDTRAHIRPISTAQQLVSWIAGILTALLAIRFVFSLLNVNQTSGFTGFIYNATAWITAPFAGLFNTQATISTGFIDLPAVAAFVAVAIIAWALISLMRVGHSTS